MKISVKGLAENLLFAANIFIVFLLGFEGSITVPYWLQPLGRMHPMVLHFPIVILILAMFLEFFRFNETNARETLYQKFTSYLLLAGALFSALTVVMGLFLSLEEGYSGKILQWHKWTGVSIVFIASIIYWCRNSTCYKLYAARAGAILTVLCIVVAGHYGATLTHGDNFVLESVTAPEKIPVVPIAEAKVFDHVVMSIFTQKCLSCHNMDKAKGGLMMDDVQSLLKGGKTGKLFVPGRPEISLLLERIHLPLDEKKHMPPKDKAQLTNEEIALLNLWIKNNADLERKVVDLPLDDSLRLLATTYLTPAESASEEYEFAAADESAIKKLNNNYRIVSPLAKESPALAVNIYNGSSFKSKMLDELTSVRKQIVSLNLSRIPVSNDDLKIIARFENLRRLNLNFTGVSDAGLKQLLVLKHLEVLSLSGTKVSSAFVKQVGKMSSLKQVSLWNTRISEIEIQQLQKTAHGVALIAGFKDDGKHPIKLNQPRVSTEAAVFRNSISLQIKHPINGVQIRYTTDGSEPDSLKSLIYNKEILLKENTTLKARAYKAGWYGSDVITSNFYRSIYQPDSILFLLPADEQYRGAGAKTLTDKQLGEYDVNSGKWIGFRQNNMEAMLFFKQPVMMQSVTLNMLRQIPNYIFPPTGVEIWGGSNKNNLRLLSIIKPKAGKEGDEDSSIKVEAKFKPQQISCIKIVAKNLKKLPVWHPGKGEPAWVFVDEIFLN
ncbi:cytochrome C [Flavihumibacter sp. R14]|nr:cytochrome C [Flavihumibacter soli]